MCIHIVRTPHRVQEKTFSDYSGAMLEIEGSFSQCVTKDFLVQMDMHINYINGVLMFLILSFLRFHCVTYNVRGRQVVWAVGLCGACVV